MEINDEIISMVILPIHLIQEGQLKYVHKEQVNHLDLGKSVRTVQLDVTQTIQTNWDTIFTLTLKAPILTAAEDILIFFFSKKISLDTSCESSASMTI